MRFAQESEIEKAVEIITSNFPFIDFRCIEYNYRIIFDIENLRTIKNLLDKNGVRYYLNAREKHELAF